MGCSDEKLVKLMNERPEPTAVPGTWHQRVIAVDKCMELEVNATVSELK